MTIREITWSLATSLYGTLRFARASSVEKRVRPQGEAALFDANETQSATAPGIKARRAETSGFGAREPNPLKRWR